MRVSFFSAFTISRSSLASPASILVVMKSFVDRGMRAFIFYQYRRGVPHVETIQLTDYLQSGDTDGMR